MTRTDLWCSPTVLKRQFVSQVHQFVRNFEDLTAQKINIIEELKKACGSNYSQFRDSFVEMLLEAVENYGFRDENFHAKLLAIITAFLEDSPSIYLRTRFWPLEFFKHGRRDDGYAAVDKFIRELEATTDRSKWSNRGNAGILKLHIRVIDFMTNPGLDVVDQWLKRAAVIDAWRPLDPESPSTLENHVHGLRLRTRGKQGKDFGHFKESYYALKEYCDKHAIRGSQEEAWAFGDLAHVVVELEESESRDEITEDLAANGIDFGEKQHLAPGVPLCQFMATQLTRAIERRQSEAGHVTTEPRRQAAPGDTVWMEIVRAKMLLHAARHDQAQFPAAEALLDGLAARYAEMQGAGTWTDDCVRHWMVMTCRAQAAHLQERWDEARARWARCLAFAAEHIPQWTGEHLYPRVARYSLVDAEMGAGVETREIGDLKRISEEAIGAAKTYEIIGLATFWLEFVHKRVAARLEGIKEVQKSGRSVVA
jgi:hypothetical protein